MKRHMFSQCGHFNRSCILLSLVCLLCSIQPVDAEQFLMVDTTVVHDIVAKPPYHGWHSHLNMKFAPDVPVNWKTPVDYYNGTAHLRIEIFEKPSKRDATYQVCINRSSSKGGQWHCCITCVPHFTEPGVYYREQKREDFWFYKEPNYTNFTGGYPQLVLKSSTEGKCSCPVTSAGLAKFHCWDGYPDMKLHYPMKVRVSVYIVAAGDELDAPAWWSDEVSAQPAGRKAAGRLSSSKLDVRSTLRGGIEIAWAGPENASIEIVRPDGVRLAMHPVDAGTSHLSVRSLPPGLYIVKSRTNNAVMLRRTVLIR